MKENTRTDEWEEIFNGFARALELSKGSPSFAEKAKNCFRQIQDQSRREGEKTGLEKAIEVAKSSRTLDETHGEGRLEGHARWQVVVDLIAEKESLG